MTARAKSHIDSGAGSPYRGRSLVNAELRSCVPIGEVFGVLLSKTTVSDEIRNARTDAAVHLSAARLHHMARELPEAEIAYRAALDIDPNLTAALYNLGVILVESRRSADALQL